MAANQTSSCSVSVHVKLTVYPAYTEAFLAALKPTMDAVVAEPLNTFFEVYKLDKEPGVFKLAENWDATAEYLNEVLPTPQPTCLCIFESEDISKGTLG